MTTRQKIVVAAFAVSAVALFAGLVAFPEWATFVLQLVGAA